MKRPPHPVAFLCVAALLLVAAGADGTLAAGGGGPRSLAPGEGKVFARGAKITFKVRDTSSYARRYHVYMTVTGRRRVRHGQLQQARSGAPGTFSSMRRRAHGIYAYTPPRYTFPTWFMQRPGRYWWQAYHIDCGRNTARNCHIVGKIHSFRVR